MIKPLYLKGENYVYFKKFYLPLDGQGIVRLKGINYDSSKEGLGSNGAGKSVLVEALQYMLFDTTTRGSKKKDLTNKNKNLFIEFSFQKDNDVFVIQKYQEHKKHKNQTFIFKNGKDITPKRGRTDTVKQTLLDIVNITKEEFFNNVFLSPRVSSVFLDGKPKEKIEYISSIFSLEAYDDLREKIKENHKEWEKKIAVLEAKLIDFKKLKKKIKKASHLPSLKKDYLRFNKSTTKLTHKVSKLDTKLEDTNRRLQIAVISDRARLVSNKLGGKQTTNPEYYLTLHSQLLKVVEKIRVELTIYQNKQVVAKQATLLKQRKKSLPKQKYSLKKLKNFKLEIKENIQNIRERKKLLKTLNTLGYNKTKHDITALKNLQDSLPPLQEKIAKLKADIQSHLKEINLYDKLDHPECPTCKHIIDQVFVKERLIILKGEKKKWKKTLTRCDSEKESLETHTHELVEFKPLLRQLKHTKKSTGKLRDLKHELKEVKQSLKYKKELIDIKKRLAKLNPEKIESVEAVIDGLRSRENIVLEKIPMAKELITLLSHTKLENFRSEDRASLEVAKKNLLNKLSSLRTKKEKCMEHKFHAKNKYARVKELHQQYAEVDLHYRKLKGLKHELSILKLLLGYCTYAKLSKIKELCVVLNEALSEYAAIMFTEQDIEFDINYDSSGLEFIVRKKDVTYPIKLLSEGERSRLGICFIFALRDVISNGKKIDLVILDEIDRHLDPIGKHVFITELLPKLSALYSSVLIISHDEFIKDNAFDKTFIVKRKNNKSKLETS